jgi:hypothetical protein
VKRKSPYPKTRKQARREAAAAKINCDQPAVGVEVTEVSRLAIDVWRVGQRAVKDKASEQVVAACERAVDRLRSIGFRVEDMLGDKYDPDMRVNVIEHQGGDKNVFITECIAPAIYFQDVLVRIGDVITKGE